MPLEINSRMSAAAVAAVLAAGCMTDRPSAVPAGLAGRPPPVAMTVVTTAYCPCGECCGWHRNCLGIPVLDGTGLMGRRKAVGQTASGAMARPGTMAADTSVFPFGTIIHVPGYGYGRVEDRGADIKGRRLDLFYRRHSDALRWGRRTLTVQVWFPPPAAD